MAVLASLASVVAVLYPAKMDAEITAHAAAMTQLANAAQIREFMAAQPTPDPGAATAPYAAALGALQSDVRGLLGIIARQQEEIEQLRAQADAAHGLLGIIDDIASGA